MKKLKSLLALSLLLFSPAHAHTDDEALDAETTDRRPAVHCFRVDTNFDERMDWEQRHLVYKMDDFTRHYFTHKDASNIDKALAYASRSATSFTKAVTEYEKSARVIVAAAAFNKALEDHTAGSPSLDEVLPPRVDVATLRRALTAPAEDALDEAIAVERAIAKYSETIPLILEPELLASLEKFRGRVLGPTNAESISAASEALAAVSRFKEMMNSFSACPYAIYAASALKAHSEVILSDAEETLIEIKQTRVKVAAYYMDLYKDVLKESAALLTKMDEKALTGETLNDDEKASFKEAAKKAYIAMLYYQCHYDCTFVNIVNLARFFGIDLLRETKVATINAIRIIELVEASKKPDAKPYTATEDQKAFAKEYADLRFVDNVYYMPAVTFPPEGYDSTTEEEVAAGDAGGGGSGGGE